MNIVKIMALVSLSLLSSCFHGKKEPVINAGPAVQVDILPGNCPYLTKDNEGNIVMSWARSTSDSTSVFCYAVSADNGRSFGKPITVPSSDKMQPHAENLPKIIFKPSGEIIALWGVANPNPSNKYSGMVFYSQSFNDGVSWSPARPLVTDTAGFDQRYYDVALLPSGEVAIIWLDNRKSTGKEGSALYFATTVGTAGFQKERRISEGCCQCCRTDLFIDSRAGIHVLYRGIIKDSIRDMLHSVSMDGGMNFSAPRLIGNDNWVIKGCPHTGPSMTENKEGLHFTWFTGGKNKGCYYNRSADNGRSFAQQQPVSAAGSHPQLSTLPGGKLVVVWDEAIQVKNKYYKKIAVQLKTASGIDEAQQFITADTLTAAYPVVASVNDHASVIAYTEKKDKKDYVMYQRVVW
jgi:hypothetical protein